MTRVLTGANRGRPRGQDRGAKRRRYREYRRVFPTKSLDERSAFPTRLFWGQLFVENPPDRMTCLRWSSLTVVFSDNAAGHFLRGWTNARRHHQATHGQGFRVHRHRERNDLFFYSSNLEGVSYEELQEGQRVSYTEGHGPKGPRAENVKPI